ARVFGLSVPQLFVCQAQRESLLYVNARTQHALAPGFVVGMPLLGDRRRQHELFFPIALRMANLSSERLFRLALPDAATLGVVIAAVIALGREVDGHGSATWSRIGQALRHHLTPLAFDQAVTVGRWLAEVGEDPSVLAARWLRG